MDYFSGGLAFSDAGTIMRQRIGQMLAAWAIYMVAIVAIYAALFGSMAAFAPQIGSGQRSFASFGAGFALFYLVYFAALFAQQVAISRTTSDRHDPSIGDAIVAGARAVPTMLAVALITALLAFGGSFVLSLLLGLLTRGAGSGVPGLILGILLFLGGFFFLTRLSLILPVVAIEETMNPIAAIAESWRLTGKESVKVAVIWFLVAVGYIALLALMAFMVDGAGRADPTGGIVALIGFFVAMIALGLYAVAVSTAIHRQLATRPVDRDAETFS